MQEPTYCPTQLNTNRPKIGYTKLYDVTVRHSIAQRAVRTAEAPRDSCQGMRKLHFTPRWYIWVVRLLTPPLRTVLLPLRPTVTRASALQNSAFEDIIFSCMVKGKGKVHPCTGTEALYRPYGP